MSQPLPYWRLSAFYFCYFAMLGAAVPFLPKYFESLGFSAARIGELVAILMLMRCFAPNIWGWLGDRTGQRLRIVRFGALCTFFSFALILFDKSYAWLALVMALHAFFWHAVLPQFEVITLNHLTGQSERYAQIRLWGSVGFIFTVVGLGALYQHIGPQVLPGVVLLILAGIFIASWQVPNAPVTKTQTSAAEGGLFKQLGKPGVLAFFICVALMQLSHGPYYTFLTLHLERLGYSGSVIGLLWALGVVAEVLIFMLMVKILKRYTLRQVLIASFVLAALRWLLLGAFADILTLLLFAQLLHAATFGSFHVACVHFVQHNFAASEQGQGQALYAALSGLGGGLGALYAGYSWDWLGPLYSFAIASAIAMLAAVIITLRLPKHSALV